MDGKSLYRSSLLPFDVTPRKKALEIEGQKKLRKKKINRVEAKLATVDYSCKTIGRGLP